MDAASTAAVPVGTAASAGSAVDALKFLSILAKLKTTPRQGWVENKVANPESVSDHMYRMSVMCTMVPDPTLDKVRMMKMALCHDMGEALIGDVTPGMRMPKEVKFAREKAAMDKMAGLIPGFGGAEILALWNEYEAQETPEARFVRDMDLLEMLAQAHEYENVQRIHLETFFQNSAHKIVHPWAKEMLAAIQAGRPPREGLTIPVREITHPAESS